MQRLLVLTVIMAGMIALLCKQPALAAGQIEWRLENTFRLFKNPEHTELHRKIYDSLSSFDRTKPILEAERALEKRFGGRGWAERVFNNTCYNQNSDRYTACRNYVLPKSHRIIARLKSERRFWDIFAEEPPSSETCYWTLKTRSGKTIAKKTAPCTVSVKFDVPYPSGADLQVSRWGGPAEVSLEIKIQDLLIVGMGDSFGAGEGNPDYPVKFNDKRSHDYGVIDIAATGSTARLAGYPARTGKWSTLRSPGFRKQRARWWDRECHRSLYSHQLRAALQLAIENPQRAVTFLSFSCSGAEILQGVLLDAPVRECSPNESGSVPGQISALSRELCQSSYSAAKMPAAIIKRMPELRNFSESSMRIRRCKTVRRNGVRRPALKRPIDLIFLSVGGNDVGFTPLVADSILSKNSIYRRLGKPLDSVYGVDRARQRIELLKKRFDGLKYAIELFFAPGQHTKVIMTGYPRMGYDGDGMSICSGNKGMEIFPAFRVDAGKAGKAEDFSMELNRSLKSFASRRWTYVDGFVDDFRAHGLCASRGNGPVESLAFPTLTNGKWSPYTPASYPAYTPRQRWFRTPNDAFLTSHMHAQAVASFGSNCSGVFSGTLRHLAKRYWPPFQLFLASTYGGAFHPTAEGQARIADEVVKAARASLAATN